MCSASGFLPGSAMMAFWPNHICSKFKVLSRKERSVVNAVCLLWQRQIWTMMDHASKKSGDFNGHVMSLIHLELGNKIAGHSCKLLKKQISSASVKPQMMRDGERANGSKAFKQSSQQIRQDEYTRYMRHHETIWNDSPFLHDANTSCSSIIHPVSSCTPTWSFVTFSACNSSKGQPSLENTFREMIWVLVPVLYLQAYFCFKCKFLPFYHRFFRQKRSGFKASGPSTRPAIERSSSHILWFIRYVYFAKYSSILRF